MGREELQMLKQKFLEFVETYTVESWTCIVLYSASKITDNTWMLIGEGK